MKLEDCSKEELIHFIKRNSFCGPSDLEFEVMMFRSEMASMKSGAEGIRACDALGEYTGLLAPFEGRGWEDVPDEIISKASEALKNYEIHTKRAEKYRKQYDAIHKRIDELLYVRETR